MCIVGQHGVKETTTAEEVSIKDESGKNANEDIQHETGALQPCEQMTKTNDGENFFSTLQLSLIMRMMIIIKKTMIKLEMMERC